MVSKSFMVVTIFVVMNAYCKFWTEDEFTITFSYPSRSLSFSGRNENYSEVADLPSISPILRSHSKISPNIQRTKGNHHLERSLYETFSFYVIGDTPYNAKDSEILYSQLKQLDRNALFIVHVGDLMKKSLCNLSLYRNAFSILKTSDVPIIVLPGDNDWVDCPSPELALIRFRRYFINRLDAWAGLSMLYRQKLRRENFFFRTNDVLFFGLNLIGTKNNNWMQRYKENLKWFHFHCDNHLDNAKGVVVFAHSVQARPVYNRIKRYLERANIPCLVLHGNGHSFQQHYFGENHLRIQVDRGGIAPPLKITIEDKRKRFVHNHSTIIFSDIFHIDRQIDI